MSDNNKNSLRIAGGIELADVEKAPESNIQTYLALGTEETGKFEIDLITVREKNQPIRYLSISLTGINLKTGEPQESFINIDNEEQFNQLKVFFKFLEWNS